MNLKAAFSKKFGPLPAGVWLGLLAVGLYAYRRMRGGGGGSSAAPATATPIDSGFGNGANAYQPTSDQQTISDPLDPSQAPSAGNLTINMPGGSDGSGNDSGDSGGSDGVDTHDPATGTTTKAKGAKGSPHTPKRPKKTTGRKKPRKAPELISEHGKGQNHLPHPKGHKAQPATRHGKAKKANRIFRVRTPAAGGGTAHKAKKTHSPSPLPPPGRKSPKVRNPDLGTHAPHVPSHEHHAPLPKPKNPPKRPRQVK